MKQETPPFATEVELCAAFSEWAKPQGWTSYPETAGFDILLVADDQTQIGIQAKMRFNLSVLEQLVQDGFYPPKHGPDFRAILTPRLASTNLCAALGVTGFSWESWGRGFAPTLDRARTTHTRWHYLNPEKRCELPRFVPDVAAGASAPTQLTKWKIAALSIAAALELRGYVTSEDFNYYGVDHRRWTGVGGWLEASDTGKFVRGPRTPAFDHQHPVVYPQVRAEVAERLALVAQLS